MSQICGCAGRLTNENEVFISIKGRKGVVWCKGVFEKQQICNKDSEIV